MGWIFLLFVLGFDFVFCLVGFGLCVCVCMGFGGFVIFAGFFACLHSEFNNTKLFIKINGFHRNEFSAIYIKEHMEHMSNQALWVVFSQTGRELYY